MDVFAGGDDAIDAAKIRIDFFWWFCLAPIFLAPESNGDLRR
jgi:hypothetical protein